MSKYDAVRLETIATIIAGQSPESEYYNKNGEGTLFYQGKKEFGFRFLRRATTWTTKSTKISVRGDILISVRAPVGSINENPFEKICIGRGLAAIRANEKVDRLYLYYFLEAIQGSISGHNGAVFDSISQSELRAIKIPLPPMNIQREIVRECEEIDAQESALNAEISSCREKIDALFSELEYRTGKCSLSTVLTYVTVVKLYNASEVITMEAVLTRPKQKYKFNRKLGDEEIEELIDNYDYDPKYLDLDYVDENDDGAIWDIFGNPKEATIRARYEAKHSIGNSEAMTLDELFAEWDELHSLSAFRHVNKKIRDKGFLSPYP